MKGERKWMQIEGENEETLTIHALARSFVPKQLQFTDIGRSAFQYFAHIMCLLVKGRHSEEDVHVHHCPHRRPVSAESLRLNDN